MFKIGVTEVYMFSSHPRVAVYLVGCLIAASTTVCTNRLVADDKAPQHLANTPAIAPSAAKPLILPEEVVAGMMIHKVDPDYPAVAKAALVSGIVILKATISKTGDIVDLRAECGPQLLQKAAIKAVQE